MLPVTARHVLLSRERLARPWDVHEELLIRATRFYFLSPSCLTLPGAPHGTPAAIAAKVAATPTPAIQRDHRDVVDIPPHHRRLVSQLCLSGSLRGQDRVRVDAELSASRNVPPRRPIVKSRADLRHVDPLQAQRAS